MSYPSPIELHIRQLAQARRAFAQNPTPALSSAIRRLEGAIKRQKESS